MNIRSLTPEDLSRLRAFWVQHWGGDVMVSRGRVISPEQLEGFVVETADEWRALLTFIVTDRELEVTSLDSLHEGQGFGSELLEQVLATARARDCHRVCLITTNDNLHALGFYQRRGFVLVQIHRNALQDARKLKPSIPLIGMNNIPLRDEIELEFTLKQPA